MSDAKTSKRPLVVPTMRFRDAPAAIDWLCRAFGFEKHLIVPGEGGRIDHAQLVLGDGMIMLGSTSDNEYGRLMKQPRDVGGNTATVYVIVPDADAHYARAKTAGAEIFMDIADMDYGGRAYGCFDIEGHIWAFGTYDPWRAP